jgi:transposase
MPLDRLARFALLPELRLLGVHDCQTFSLFEAEKTSAMEVCPRCATPSESVYDRRWVKIKDAPIRGRLIILRLRKRRFSCRPCKKPFTEPVAGISKAQRTTQRYRWHLLWACDNFSSLKDVRKHLRCSDGYLYQTLYERLDLQARKRRYPWPKAIGLDEHYFKKNPQKRFPEFVSIVVDHTNKRVFELVDGRTGDDLNAALRDIPGRENVEWATIDLSTTYRSFIKNHFPNAKIVADKFHVLRLLHPVLNKQRKAIAGDRRTNPIGRLLLRNGKDLSFFERSAVYRWLEDHPELKEIYSAKEALFGFYRIKGADRARRAFIAMCDRFGRSTSRDVKRLRRTLLAWQSEILNYFVKPLTNGRVEGFNGKAKLIRKRAYGYRSFRNYRLRLLNECA